jgi:hypothetical protein
LKSNTCLKRCRKTKKYDLKAVFKTINKYQKKCSIFSHFTFVNVFVLLALTLLHIFTLKIMKWFLLILNGESFFRWVFLGKEAAMNYQGALVRKDLVWSGVVFWFLVRYYPHLSAVLLLCLLISTYWESTSQVLLLKLCHLENDRLFQNITLQTSNVKIF